MPDINFQCPKCGQHIEAPSIFAAQLVDCPTCNERIQIPFDTVRPSSEESAPPPPASSSIDPHLPSFGRAKLESLVDRHDEPGVITILLGFLGLLQFVAAPIAGLQYGVSDTFGGWVVFAGAVYTGTITLGLAAIVYHTDQSSRRLRRIENAIIDRWRSDQNQPQPCSQGNPETTA